jgi:hypothetical protein
VVAGTHSGGRSRLAEASSTARIMAVYLAADHSAITIWQVLWVDSGVTIV